MSSVDPSIKQLSDLNKAKIEYDQASVKVNDSILEEERLVSIIEAAEEALELQKKNTTILIHTQSKAFDAVVDVYKKINRQRFSLEPKHGTVELGVSSKNHEDVQTQNLKNAMDGTTMEPLGHN